MMKIIAVLEIRIFVVPYALYALKSIKNGNCNTQQKAFKNEIKKYKHGLDWLWANWFSKQRREVKFANRAG